MKKNTFLVFLLIISAISSVAAISRKPGVWQSIKMLNGPGRITDVEFDPKNGDRLYCAPDGDGIWYTEDLGKHWVCITKNLPEVQDRVGDKDFMVDPQDFNTIYYVADNGAFYITHDQGKNWLRVKDKAGKDVQLTDFKRSRMARQADGSVTLVCTSIGRMHAENSTWPMGLHVSNDGGITWKNFPNPSKDEMFLEIAIHPTNPKIIYAPTNLRLYKSVDAGKTFTPVFEFTGPAGGNANICVSPCFPDKVWLITGGNTKTKKTEKNAETGKEEEKEENIAATAIYLSNDAATTWTTIQDGKNGIGFKGSVFDGDSPGSWLNNFVVNPQNPNMMLAALDRMMETTDGGKNWTPVHWWERRNQLNPDGTIEPAKLSHHSADNQNIKYHPAYANRVYRACDAGLFIKDPENGFEDWTSITGNIGNSLMYSVITNDFGDEKIIEGNSQDVDIQVFFNNKWQYNRGYEGDAIIINPYSNISNYPYAPSGDLQQIAPYGKDITSWGRPVLYADFNNPDEQYLKWVYSNGKKRRDNCVSFTNNRGRTWETVEIPYSNSIQFLALSRTNPTRVFAFGRDSLFISADKGKTWTIRTMPKRDVTYGTIDPLHPEKIWVTTTRNVYYSSNEGQTWDTINSGLPKDNLQKILFHDGSKGDLYLLTRSNGIYYLDTNAPIKEWKHWMEGFYLPGFNDMTIDYQRQKMLGASYGNGVWEADLMHPCERFAGAKARIKQVSQVANKSIFALELPHHTPSFYDLKWQSNKGAKSNNWYFHATDIKIGDTIRCEANVHLSNDVKLEVEPLIITNLVSAKSLQSQTGLLLDSTALKIGWSDFYRADSSFTVSLTAKPMSNGVLIANRNWNDFDAKGWLIAIDNGQLVVKTSALTNLNGYLGEEGNRYNVLPTEKLRVPVKMNEWQTITLNYNSIDKTISISINGQVVGTTLIPLADHGQSLNSIMDLTVGADALGYYPIKAQVKELKIWNNSTAQKSRGRKRKANTAVSSNLVIHANFNDNTSTELYSAKVIEKISVKKKNILPDNNQK